MRKAISCSRHKHCQGSKTCGFRRTTVSCICHYRARPVSGSAVGGAGVSPCGRKKDFSSSSGLLLDEDAAGVMFL